MSTAIGTILVDDQQMRNETALKLALPFLSIRDLLAASVTNHHFLDHIRSRQDLWMPFYEELDSMMGIHPFMVENTSAEQQCEIQRILMKIPPRVHGEQVDRDLFQSHPSDSTARLHDWGPLLYCMEFGNCPHWDIGESGELLDLFVVEGTNELVYLPREFPIFCEDCKLSIKSTEELIEHCKSDAHLFAKEPRLFDPRSQRNFRKLGAFEKTKALTIYPLRVASVFRNIITKPSSQDAIDFVTMIVKTLIHQIMIQVTDWENPNLSGCSSDVISELCVDYITDGFFAGDKHALLMVHAGWQKRYGYSYFFHGLGSYLCNQVADYLLEDCLLNEGENFQIISISSHLQSLGL